MSVQQEVSPKKEDLVDEKDSVENGFSSDQEDFVEREECRDFKKGDCRRGSNCKYYHTKVEICRDFQNRKCMRQNCRFKHITYAEEAAYENSGILPGHINYGLTMNNNVMNATQAGRGVGFNGILGRGQPGNFGLSSIPAPFGLQNKSQAEQLCRDFEKGDCRRGTRCKYHHPKLKICRDFQNQKCEREKCKFLHMTHEEEETYDDSGIVPDHIDKEEVMKKRVMNPPSGNGALDVGVTYGQRNDNFNIMPGLSNIPLALWQENETLKLKIMELQQQITDVYRMNDTLYELNQNYRGKIRGGGI